MAEGGNLSVNEIFNNENAENIGVPPSNWVFTTPPTQKLKPPILKSSSIQTAYMCKNKRNQGEMYELKSNVKLDLSKFNSLKEIPFDPNYMRAVVFDHEKVQEYDILEPSRKTKFVSRFQLGCLTQQSADKLKKNLFD